MSGMKNVLPFAFTDTSLKKLYDDPILTEGSLALVDLAHPNSTPFVGVPANGARLPNLAWKEAAATIGSGDATSLSATWEKGSALTSSIGIIERSTKGGIHVIMSPTAVMGTGRGAGIRPAEQIATWMAAHPDHRYYASVWWKFTRFGNNTCAVVAYALNSAPSQSTNPNLMLSIGVVATYPTTVARLGYRRSRDSDWRPSFSSALTPPYSEAMLATVAVNGYTGTPNLTGAAAAAQMALFGAGQFLPFGGSHTSGDPYGFSSRLWWRSYLEDLTVSGRSHAEVDAIDASLFTKYVLTPGGYHYDDTYTDPASVSFAA